MHRYRNLTIHVVPLDKPVGSPVHRDGIDIDHLFDFTDVHSRFSGHTGIDFVVQAMFLMQGKCASVIKDAIDIIDSHLCVNAPTRSLLLVPFLPQVLFIPPLG